MHAHFSEQDSRGPCPSSPLMWSPCHHVTAFSGPFIFSQNSSPACSVPGAQPPLPPRGREQCPLDASRGLWACRKLLEVCPLSAQNWAGASAHEVPKSAHQPGPLQGGKSCLLQALGRPRSGTGPPGGTQGQEAGSSCSPRRTAQAGGHLALSGLPHVPPRQGGRGRQALGTSTNRTVGGCPSPLGPRLAGPALECLPGHTVPTGTELPEAFGVPQQPEQGHLSLSREPGEGWEEGSGRGGKMEEEEDREMGRRGCVGRGAMGRQRQAEGKMGTEAARETGRPRQRAAWASAGQRG